uniref:(northern house mosquito) hypothetical protein n=1 Tax=Culex pipiens TaxID=7175 RepID=A0A8D8AW75_CULPI
MSRGRVPAAGMTAPDTAGSTGRRATDTLRPTAVVQADRRTTRPALPPAGTAEVALRGPLVRTEWAAPGAIRTRSTSRRADPAWWPCSTSASTRPRRNCTTSLSSLAR